MMPRLVIPQEKETRMTVTADILRNIETDPNVLKNVIKCDESCFFAYDPETKFQSMYWKSPHSPRQKKARQTRSKFNALMIVFLDIKGLIHVDLKDRLTLYNNSVIKRLLENGF